MKNLLKSRAWRCVIPPTMNGRFLVTVSVVDPLLPVGPESSLGSSVKDGVGVVGAWASVPPTLCKPIAGLGFSSTGVGTGGAPSAVVLATLDYIGCVSIYHGCRKTFKKTTLFAIHWITLTSLNTDFFISPNIAAKTHSHHHRHSLVGRYEMQQFLHQSPG